MRGSAAIKQKKFALACCMEQPGKQKATRAIDSEMREILES
jgi:hypothetical protein